MDYPEDDVWPMALMDWLRRRQRCHQVRQQTDEGPVEKRSWTGALLFVATLVASVLTALCILECWRSRAGEERKWNGAKEEVRMMVEKEIDMQLNQFESDDKIQFTLQASSQIDDGDVVIGWRNARYSLSQDREYVVPSTDYFMIYTCLSFFAPPSEGDVVTYWQELVRARSQGGANDTAVLMRDVQAERCKHSLSGTTEMAFCLRSRIVVILRLRQGDRIFVKASHPDLVSRADGTSYFGILRMN